MQKSKKYHVVLLAGYTQPGNSVRPYGPHKCAMELRAAGFDTIVLNHVTEFTPEELQQFFQATVSDQTLMLGLSNTFMHDLPTEQIESIIDLARACNPEIKIVVGGAETKFNAVYSYADYVVMGYADLSIVNLARHLSQGEPLLKSSRSVYGNILINDSIAEGFDFYNSTGAWHRDDMIVPQERVLPLEVSRGCIFSCGFCNYRLNGKKDNTYIKNLDNLRSELTENYQRHGIRHYRILDDTFNDNRYKLQHMLELVKSLPFQPQFWAYIRLDLLAKHPETIQQLIDIGVISMTFGIETLNQRTGRIIGKGYNPEQLIRTVQQIKQQHGNTVSLFGHFISGLPEESRDSVLSSYRRIISRELPLDGWSFKHLKIHRENTLSWASAFGVDLTRYGYVDLGDVPGEPGLVNWTNPYMTRADAQKLEKITSKQQGYGGGFLDFNIINLGLDLQQIREENTSVELTPHYNDYIEHYRKFVLNYVNYDV